MSACRGWDGYWGAWPGSTQTLGTVRALAWWEHMRTPQTTTWHQPAESTHINAHTLVEPFTASFYIVFSPHPCLHSPQVVSCLLLFLEEEDVLWMMCALIEDLLPPSYFSSTLLGVQTDQRVLRQLIVQYLPALDRLLQEHDIGKGERVVLGVKESNMSVWWTRFSTEFQPATHLAKTIRNVRNKHLHMLNQFLSNEYKLYVPPSF